MRKPAQGRFEGPHGHVWADDVGGTGFSVLTDRADPSTVLGLDHISFLRSIGTGLGTFDPREPGHLRDADGRLSAWLADNHVEAVIIGPDGYTLDGVADVRDLPGLVDGLRDRVRLRTSAGLLGLAERHRRL